MKKVSLPMYIRYKFDNLMSKGTFAPLSLLIAISILSVVIWAVILYFSNALPHGEEIAGYTTDDGFTFLESVWIILLRTLDGGVIAEDPNNNYFLMFMLVATLGGLLILSVFIGIINSGVRNKISELRKGRSFVVEKNHTVILGWSFQVFPIIEELVIANENQKNPCIAILAEEDKVVMEDAIKAHVDSTKNTKVVCRTGNPIDLHDLEIINLHKAKSIIIIAPDSADPDSNVIKTILAITNNPHRRPSPHKYHIVAEIRDPRNVVIAEIAGKDEVQLVIFDYLISRITAQTCRQPGLSVVFTELLDFSGAEIYFRMEERIFNKTFIEAMFAFETSTIIGIRKNDGRILIKPPMYEAINEGDKLIAISEDDDTIILSGITEYNIDTGAIRKSPKYIDTDPENTLILGWNRRAPLIMNELDKYVMPGSKITLVAAHPHAEKELSVHCANLRNQTVTFWFGDTSNRRILDDLQIDKFNHIIVLSQVELTDVQSTDAKTLSTLLHLRDIADTRSHTFSIVSEMLDDRNRQLAEITHTDDFIVSVKIDSLMLSQISENKELKIVFELLFSAKGPGIYIRPAQHYVELNRAVNFYTVMESARQQNEIAIGYKLSKPKRKYDLDGQLSHGVTVNPVKSNQIFFAEGDKIIVISDEEENLSV